MKLNATQLSTGTLVSNAPRGFSVPDFQRNYAWGEEQVSQFWADVKSLLDGSVEDHFLGPVVLLEADNSRKPVIDGQQRLTTLVILASVIRDYLLLEMDDPHIDVEGNRIVVSQKLTPLLFLPDLKSPRLEGNYQIRAIIENYVVRNPNTPERKHFADKEHPLNKSQARASKNVELAQSTLKRLFVEWIEAEANLSDHRVAEINSIIEAILNKIQFLVIEVGNEEDAFTIFETLNDRGLKLSPGDLIKSYLLRRIMEQNPATDRQSIIDDWERILENLEDYDVSNFLRHYLLTKFNQPIQKKVIFSHLKGKMLLNNSGELMTERQKLDDIANSSLYYGLLLGNNGATADAGELERRLSLISMVGESYRIFLLKAMQLGFKDEDLLLAIRASEILTLRWNIAKENAQELETLFRIAAHKLIKSDSAGLKEICRELVLKSPTDEVVLSAFTTKVSRDTSLQAFVMRSLCVGLTGSDVTTSKKEVSVEHIAPQKPKLSLWYERIANIETDANELSYEDYLYMWGNITILEKKLNSSVSNSTWETKLAGTEKYKGYRASGIVVTNDLLGVKEWNKEQILKRTKWVAENAIKYWPRELVAIPSGKLSNYQP
jgi:hypothetical protein